MTDKINRWKVGNVKITRVRQELRQSRASSPRDSAPQ
jgi:hypothetical protein